MQFAVEEDRVAVLEGRLSDAEGVLLARHAAYEHMDKPHYDKEDEDNPQPSPRGEEKCRVGHALDLIEVNQRPFKATTPPSEEMLDGVEQSLAVIESIINDTPADEKVPRILDDEDGGYDWDEDDALACAD